MAFPNFKGKHSHDSMFSPKDFFRYMKSIKKYPKFKAPEAVIFCYQRTLMEYILKNHKVEKVEGFAGELYLLKETNGKVAVSGRFGIGSPVVVTLFEALIEYGVKRFISIGTAGGLQKDLKAGDIVVCDRAIRDEGTSHHYIKHSKYSYASKDMTDKIKKAFDRQGQKYLVGTSWTVDAPYRETIAEARHYQKEGVLTVEMEASALFAVAKYRKIPMGAIFTISDSLAELEWKPDFGHKKTEKGLEIVYKVALESLLKKQ